MKQRGLCRPLLLLVDQFLILRASVAERLRGDGYGFMEASKNAFGVVKQALPASDGIALRAWTARLNRLIGFGPISLHPFLTQANKDNLLEKRPSDANSSSRVI